MKRMKRHDLKTPSTQIVADLPPTQALPPRSPQVVVAHDPYSHRSRLHGSELSALSVR
jgi:hypothetical protein